MSFEEQIQQLKHLAQKRYPVNMISSKRVKIQEAFPEEYATFEVQEEKDKLRDSIYRRANAIAHHIVNPLGPNNRCYIPDCVQRGECYKEEMGELIKLHAADIDENLQLFRTKYPDEFRRFLQEEPKHDLHGSNEIHRKEYLQGMFVRIRKEYEPTQKKADKPIKTEKPRVKKADKSRPDPVDKPEKPKRVKKTPDPRENPTKKGISSTIKRLVWNKNIGEEIGKAKCWCCKSTDITQSSFHCGHVVAESKGGQTQVNNLKPICQNCNSSMGTRDMNDFMKTLE